jgi:predicted GNAT family acetyltransferase
LGGKGRSVSASEIKVIHNTDKNRFEVQLDSYTAELNYYRSDAAITFTHTGVPSEIEGCGIGSMLVKAGLEYARSSNLRVQSHCWFVDQYMQRHPKE